jgi:ubiquitin C-terminal hydrolase
VGLPRGCCGIRNQGNTCYQNTAVQLLCCVPELVGALLGQQAVQLLRAAAADATNNRSKASVQRALLVAAAAAQAGIAWLPKASVGPALQQLVREMWGFQELQERSQGSSPVRKQVAQRPQAQLQEQQQQLQRVTACMTALREAMAEVDPRWDDGDQWDCQEFALTLLQMVHVS